MNQNQFFTVILALTFSLNASAQYFNYTGNTLLGTSNPLQLNPAFAGSETAPRIIAGAGTSPGLLLQKLNLSYDQYIKKLKGGISARLNATSFGGQVAGKGMNSIMLCYSPKFSTTNKWTFAPALEVGIAQKWTPLRTITSRLTGSIGFLLNSHNTYFGAYTSYLGGDHSIEKISIQSGHVLDLSPHLKVSVDGQYQRETTLYSLFSELPPQNIIGQSYLLSLGVKYHKLKLTLGIHYSTGKTKNTDGSGIHYKSKIAPMVSIGYFGDRISVQGTVLFNQNYTSNSPILHYQKYRTAPTSEITASYTFNGKKDKK